jgi:ABC-2 type transport system permease protein
MTLTLVRKLLRDVRLPLLAVAFLLGAFQCLWARVTERILGNLSPFLNTLAGWAGLTAKDVEQVIFEGPGQVIRTLIGGENIVLDNAMDMLSIGLVHPLMQVIFCIWAVGRAAGAIAGEIDRGTMELLLAQPVARSRLIAANFLVDLLTIPILCLSLWAGQWIGAAMITPIKVKEPDLDKLAPKTGRTIKIAGLEVSVDDLLARMPQPSAEEKNRLNEERLKVEPLRFGPPLVLVAGLIFAVGGYTMWLSAAGRSRWRVLGLAVFITLLQFLVNLIGQMWDPAAPLRPLTVFYYYQPQQLVLASNWVVTLREWNGGQPLLRVPMPAVLYSVGAVGYLGALWTLIRRDLPAPL